MSTASSLVRRSALLALLLLHVKLLVWIPSAAAFSVRVGHTSNNHNRRCILRVQPADLFFASPSIQPTTAKTAATTIPGPPVETKPDYANQVGPLGRLLDTLFLVVFRIKLAEQVADGGIADSKQPWTEYQGITELAARMNREIPDRSEIQRRAQDTLRSLFPSWLPGRYAVMFSKPFPAFSARMNAWATYVAGTWLMGECEVNDVQEIDGGGVGKDQGLLVKRCRFLEESQCASVCVNSCKIPTQNFFLQDMGLPLTMEPNYETFECQFSFGKTPDAETEQLAKSTPCLMQCPANGALRKFHNDRALKTAAATTSPATTYCELMGND